MSPRINCFMDFLLPRGAATVRGSRDQWGVLRLRRCSTWMSVCFVAYFACKSWTLLLWPDSTHPPKPTGSSDIRLMEAITSLCLPLSHNSVRSGQNCAIKCTILSFRANYSSGKLLGIKTSTSINESAPSHNKQTIFNWEPQLRFIRRAHSA